MQYLVLCDSVARDSFLWSQLGLSSIASLRIGGEQYLHLFLQQMKCFAEYKVVMVHEPLQDLQQVIAAITAADPAAGRLVQEVSVFYYDLSLFPVRFEDANSMFAKLSLIDKGASFHLTAPDGRRVLLPVRKYYLPDRKGRFLARAEDDSETVAVEANGKFLDMQESRTIIDLFANNFQTRYFNKLTHDGVFIRKMSTDKKKMRAEYDFYQNLPAPVKPYYPHVGAWLQQDEMHGYQIERMYMLDASKLLLNGALTPPALSNLLEQLLGYFSQCPRHEVTVPEYRTMLRELFITKAEQRYHLLMQLPVAAKLDALCHWNGYPGIAGYQKELLNAIEQCITASQETSLCFSHGDLCLSNILFDVRTRQVKLIDPRGYAGDSSSPYFPIYYDIAKLSHSLLGGYDYIVNGLAAVHLTEGLTFSTEFSGGACSGCEALFADFLNRLNVSVKYVRLFEASLFLSMLPLHKDSPKRMAAQLLQSMNSFSLFVNSGK